MPGFGGGAKCEHTVARMFVVRGLAPVKFSGHALEMLGKQGKCPVQLYLRHKHDYIEYK